jgi:uncharacterized protein (TIGR02246 family)
MFVLAWKRTCCTDFMTTDERAIRELVDRWLAATRAGDYATVLNLMADDVIFMVAGQEPFGKEQFAAQAIVLKDFKVEATGDIQELEIAGNWAWMRNYLKVTMTPVAGKPCVVPALPSRSSARIPAPTG